MMCLRILLGTSLTMCHLRDKEPFHLSCCQYSKVFSKSTAPVISATPTNCPLVLTLKKQEYWAFGALSLSFLISSIKLLVSISGT
ncbi:hypothetical protein EE612_015425 [Oryza sativa]|nr:hypothetical protein EE612_015425 [Oryza sativa]